MEGFSKITHKGKEIWYHDYSGFANDKATQKEKTLELRRHISKQYENEKKLDGSVLDLLNVKDFSFDMEVLKFFNDEVKRCDHYEKKCAIVGVKGLVKAAYNFVVGFSSNKVKVFDSLDEAKDWLVIN